MDYQIVGLTGKKLYGLSTILTRSQSQNYTIITGFWRTFNNRLKSSGLSQKTRSWEKYAITYKHDGSYRYFCGIPVYCPDFEEKVIRKGPHAVFRHQGPMYQLKDTVQIIYKQIVPSDKLQPDASGYFHFERYDHRFGWNNSNSEIEVYLPLMGTHSHNTFNSQ